MVRFSADEHLAAANQESESLHDVLRATGFSSGA